MKNRNNYFVILLLVLAFTMALNIVPAQAQQNKQENSSLCIAERGDHLWRIAQKHNVKFSKVLRRNDHFKNKNVIYPGNRVYLPPNVETDAPAPKEEVTPPEEPVREETPQEKPETQPEKQPTEQNNPATFEAKVIELVNQERQQNGLEPYQSNQQLSNVARTKSKDMRDKNYFSHQSPTYGSPFEMLKQFNVQYRAAGENIAKGQQTPAEVVNSWMNSPGHRRNILSQQFTQIGVGFAQNKQGETFWTQLFIRPQ
jgi:uncharacterized YkwD family protein